MDTIINEIDSYVRLCGGAYPTWYVGVAADPQRRLFIDHYVNKATELWIFRDCGTDTAARLVEQYFLDRGCKGGPGGGDHHTRFVYAYRITASTIE